ncbi:MAG TPA: M1 family aminopeptidase [Propionibacteriaceae bacterium]|nr:M1 family aminopeptidase [Propionibacteriaceae bacterium]
MAGIRYWDAIDPSLFEQPEPRTGEQYATPGAADLAYQRLSRVIAVPAGGGRLSFQVTRDTEEEWDYFFVEAHRPGTDDWTTLPDLNGHTAQEIGPSCPDSLDQHPFLTHYLTGGDEACSPSGSTGDWHAATGQSEGYEAWSIDLSAYAGQSVEIALSVVTDQSFAFGGAYVDDVVGPNGAGTTSFEDDDNPLDGWVVAGPPTGSPGNTSDWQVATEALTPSTGDNARAALNRQPEIIDFLSGLFGKYPFGQGGGIVDNDPGLGFALENQTRPIYAQGWFSTPGDNTSVVVHEIAHQWTGDSLALAGWQHIWLNEGFASYTEWLWSEDQGGDTAQQIYDLYATRPADDPFWELKIGDPGPTHLFDGPVYDRGAMTLHALRTEIGDEDFFDVLREWVASQSGGNVTTAEFQALAEQVSGEDLNAFFETWLFTPSKPPGITPAPGTKSKKAALTQRTLDKVTARR